MSSSQLPVESGKNEQSLEVGRATGAPAAIAQWSDAPPPEEAPLDPRRYIAAVFRYRWIVLLLTALGAVAGFLVAQFQPASYEAQATIWVELPSGQRSGPIQEDQLLRNTNWVDLLRSYTVLDSVVTEQRLYLQPSSAEDTFALRSFAVKERFQPGEFELRTEGNRFTLRLKGRGVVHQGNVGDSVGPELGFAWVPPAAALAPGSTIKFEVMSPRRAALELSGRLVAQIPPQNGNFIRMRLTGPLPVQTAATLNSIASEFVHVAAELKREKLRELTHILDLQLQRSFADLRRAEVALESFRVNTITEPTEDQQPVVAGLQSTQNTAMTRFFDMKTEADQLRLDREAVQRVMALPPDSGITPVMLEAIPSVQNNADLENALEDLTSREATLRVLRARYTDDHPSVVQAQRELNTLQRQTIPAQLRQLVTELGTREAALAERVATASRDLRQIPARTMEEARLTREMTIANQLYTNLSERYQEARLADASSIPDVRILDGAIVPDRPASNRAPLIILGGLAGGLGLAIGLALLLDRFDRRFRYPDQVSHEMGLTILGALPRVKKNGASDPEDTRQVVEALRSIRLNLVHAYGSAGPLITTVTSPGGGDGKSFLSANLAMAFADAGHRTLLVDGDIRRGSLHRVLEANRKPGLIDFLSGQATREDVLQRTKVSGVDFIGCGTRKMGGPELLASPAMSQLLIGMRSQYSVIIVDSAPLGAGVDPLVLGSLTGSLLLVFRTGVTDRELATAKLGDLDRLAIRVLGAVINDVKPQGMYKYYSYLPGYSADDEQDSGAPRTLPVKAGG